MMMMRGVNNNNNISSSSSIDTVTAAASAIVSAEARVQPTHVQLRNSGKMEGKGKFWILGFVFGVFLFSLPVEKRERKKKKKDFSFTFLGLQLAIFLGSSFFFFLPFYFSCGLAWCEVKIYKKRRWGGCWSLYWCFGSYKSSKRIGHAVLVPEPEVPGAVAPSGANQSHSTAIVLPFIAPPSSPASVLQSDPPSATQSPAGLLSLTSLSANAYSPRGPSSIFAIGPYAHETQLVTPPVFSAFTTEPSTAPFTPPSESVQLTTPSSPEVPFAQLLTSSLERARRNSGTNHKFALSHYEFQPYQLYPGSPGGHLISPGSAISNSGTSTPFPDKHPLLEVRMGEAPKLLGFEHFTTRKWGSRLGSGSLTPDGAGLGSRLGSGALTPDGVGLGSRLGSGTATPDGAGLCSRLGSGTQTPECVGPGSRDGFFMENQISEVASLANLENGSKTDEVIVDHRVSFELSGEEVARCLANKSASSPRNFSECPKENMAEDQIKIDMVQNNGNSARYEETCNEEPEKTAGETEEEHFYKKQRSITLGSIKEFNFDNSNGEVSEKPTSSSEWWANETFSGKEARPSNSWTFFPLLQPEVS